MYTVIWQNTKTHTTREYTFPTREEAEEFIWFEQMSCDYVVANLRA